MGNSFDPNALLYRWLFREDDGLVRLIGTDPALADRTRFFRWPSVPGGWDQRVAWSNDLSSAEVVDNSIGAPSGWPGAVPLRRKVGRPPKSSSEELADGDKPVGVKTLVRRIELFEIQRLAADGCKSVSEWVAATLRDELARARDQATRPANANAPSVLRSPDDDKSVGVKTFVRRSELFEMQHRASDSLKSVSEWVAAVLRDAIARARGSA